MTDANARMVLIVEDTDYIADLAARVLQQIGFQTHQCYTSEDAISYMEQNPLPDLIVLDIGMPGMSGWQFLDVIKQYEETKLIPIVVTTAFGDAANRLIGKLRDVDRYLTKPYQPKELQAVVTQILEEHLNS